MMEFSLKTGTSRVVSDKCVLSPLKYTISQNGKYLYTIIEENGTWKIWRHRLWDPSLDILLYTFENEVCCPAINAGDNQLLLCTEHDGIYALCSLDLNTGTLTTLLEDTDKEYAYPQWIDGHRFLFQVGWDEPSEKESTLCIYDISSKIVQDLGTFIFDPLKPSLHPKGTAVIVTIYPDIEKDQSQILLIDIGTGKQTLLRPDACATAGALFSPCGEKVAYMESDAGWDSEEGLYYFKVLNLKTGDDKIIWSSRK
ncbi:MAG: hypothetical protein KAH38_08620 [Candidatus Hydrogenedentes bacterium]|nr:hypothetical protein [Candidatus Hydrogenedentota bacterium]